MALAVRLIHASDGLLSYEGLANPSRMLPKHIRAGSISMVHQNKPVG